MCVNDIPNLGLNLINTAPTFSYPSNCAGLTGEELEQCQCDLNNQCTQLKTENISSYSVHGIQPSLSWKIKGLESKTESSVGYWSSNISFEGTPVYGSVFDLSQTLRQNIKSLGLNLSVNYRYVGPQPIFRLINESIQTDKIEAYHLLNVSAQKSFFDNKISLTLGAKNLLNIQSALISGANTSGAHSSSGSLIISQGQSIFFCCELKTLANFIGLYF